MRVFIDWYLKKLIYIFEGHVRGEAECRQENRLHQRRAEEAGGSARRSGQETGRGARKTPNPPDPNAKISSSIKIMIRNEEENC